MSETVAVTPMNFSKPQRPLLGPYDQFPLQPERSYTPPEAPFAMHKAMLDFFGFERGVIVQPSAYGDDNRCIVDAVSQAPGARRAIGVAAPAVAEQELARLYAAGVHGLRFVELISKKYGGRPKGAIGFVELEEMAPRLREQGIHAQTFSTTQTLIEWAPRLVKAGIPIVVDHMAAAGASGVNVEDQGFKTLLGLLADGLVWMKLTVVRRSTQAPDYPDARAFHDAFCKANPDRVLWGTDWPLVNMGASAPDIGKLIDLLDDWTTDEDLRRKILVDNPAALYRF
jgi:2-pyrone-4,6-dicarboxylate lactonase